jgi:hypothetical protein
MNPIKITLMVDRESVHPGDDLISHQKQFSISSKIKIRDLGEYILDNYAFPTIVTDHVWFVGKINGEKIFTVQEYGQNVGKRWEWKFKIEYNVNENTPIMKYLNQGSIKIYFEYKYDDKVLL